MRATGIVRRIDDLGRVVIPREIRKNLGIKEGDPLEIFVDPVQRMVCFQKYETTINDTLEEAIRKVETYEGVIEADRLRAVLQRAGYNIE
jgi:AbrB family looped-hinge helix DNA binding protein